MIGMNVRHPLLFNSNIEIQKNMFNTFKMEHAKVYGADEEPIRFKNFVDNLKVIDARNNIDTAEHGITKFSDLSQEEFASMYLQGKSSASVKSDFKEVMTFVPSVNATGLVDWSGVLTTPVKDQGYCGSCWAFSATEQLESDAMRVFGSSYVLSAEQTNQCTPYFFGGGCNGGLTEKAFDYMTSTPLVQDSDYPYTKTTYQGITGSCEVDTKKGVLKVSKYTTITGETNMANYVQSNGPLSVCVAASTWNTYKSGVMTSCPGSVDHCVQAVGVDTTSKTGYWKVRNSWGTSWGESGYIRFTYGSDTCKITDDPIWVTPLKA